MRRKSSCQVKVDPCGSKAGGKMLGFFGCWFVFYLTAVYNAPVAAMCHI